MRSSFCALIRLFSSQVLLTISCISRSWASNLLLISWRSSSARCEEPPTAPPPPLASFFFSSSISAFRREICEASSFFVAETLMAFARLAYRRVESVSSQLQAAGESAASMVHSELPPRDSCSTLVSFEFRKGTKIFLPFAFSTRALMTFPRALRLLLMLAPSLSVCPLAPVPFCLSDPARSTRFSLANTFLDLSSSSFWCTLMVKIECDLELTEFIRVELTARFLVPESIIFPSLSESSTVISCRSFT